MCTTSFHPTLASAAKFQIRYAHPILLDCHQLCMVIVANGCGCTQGLQLCARPAFTQVLQNFKFGTRIRPRFDCHQLHIVMVAKLYAWLQEPSRPAFCSVVIFVKYREVSTCMILPNFIGNCRDSFAFAFGRGIGKREKEEAYVEEAYARKVLSCFNLTPL